MSDAKRYITFRGKVTYRLEDGMEIPKWTPADVIAEARKAGIVFAGEKYPAAPIEENNAEVKPARRRRRTKEDSE